MKKGIISGVYKITNSTDGRFYIGCSSDIYERWKSHKRRVSNTGKEHLKPLYKAMREFGEDKFQMEILEICNETELIEREKYWINKLNALEVGYNVKLEMETHNNVKLSLNDIIDIRTRYGNRETKRFVYEDYKKKIGKRGFDKVWAFETWKKVMPEVYTEENRCFHKCNTSKTKDEAEKAKVKEDYVKNIRLRKKKGESRKDVYSLYGDKMSFASFKCIWQDLTWKHIVVD